MPDVTQGRLLRWAALFLFLQSIILTLSPAVRERSWDVDYRLSHWIAYCVWLVLVIWTHRVTSKRLPERDPYILPAAALLGGWGLLTIWRLDEAFGLRQTLWYTLGTLAFTAALLAPKNLLFLRRYKYVLLFSGLVLTALTLLFGTNPQGYGPRLWLGCCGFYFQPSEPLKLLLVIYLSAYLADRAYIQLTSLHLLVPTISVTGLALLLLVVQRDLGTASIFICIFAMALFFATGKRRILLAAAILLSLTLFAGFFFIDTIHIRVNAWTNPWADPSGNSYQIVQSVLAVANGGILGRGYGIGNPSLVPVAISDFIYAAVSEETGLFGTIGLLLLLWIIIGRGYIIALRAADRFRRYLAAGVSSYLGIQSLLIIGGNVRLLPLTGVTLPFVSYGGSSLLTSFLAVFILLTISNLEDSEPATLADPKPYIFTSGLMGLGVAACVVATSWWAVVRTTDLLDRTDNPRRSIADRYVERGNIVDQNNQPIDITEGESGAYTRQYLYPDLSPVTGYTHPVYGQAGLEASLDPFLRGMQGNGSSLIWWDHLLYGTPPPGLDVRLSIDLAVQNQADKLLGATPGGVILMNAQTGEILAMASHPTYDPNNLTVEGERISNDLSSPLLNRAAQGSYPIGDLLAPLVAAEFGTIKPTAAELTDFYRLLGLFHKPAIDLPVTSQSYNPGVLAPSPLQISIAASVLSNHGITPAPRIAIAVNTPGEGWVVLPAQDQSVTVMSAGAANDAAHAYLVKGKSYWSHISTSKTGSTTITWMMAGTLPDWSGTPLILVAALEENNTYLARAIRDGVLNIALSQ